MNIPDTEHYAVIQTNRIYMPGDTRSREAPGHGYPEHYEESVTYDFYLDLPSLEKIVTTLMKSGIKFRVFHVRPMQIKFEPKVTFK